MTELVITFDSAVADLHGTVSKFERLPERAHEQIAALAVTIVQLERPRADIERHLPRSAPSRSLSLSHGTGDRRRLVDAAFGASESLSRLSPSQPDQAHPIRRASG